MKEDAEVVAEATEEEADWLASTDGKCDRIGWMAARVV
jgi:hypothetical protein